MENLEKIDIIRERLEVSYEQAYQALQECDGNVVEALIKLEKESTTGTKKNIKNEKIFVRGQELIDRVKEIIKEGNVNKIVVKNNDNTLVEIPVTAGVVSVVLFPYLTLLAGAAAMYKEYTLEIDRKNENIENPFDEEINQEDM
ncbi:MAG: DUF4342 domain-containing protein [Halanaerobiaceae bacterium]